MTRRKPLAIDLFCGVGGWTEGLLSEGYDVVGFDIQRHEYGEHRYPAQLVLQDVRLLHGRQFRDATLIVASPPCQEYSYMAMPWTRGRRIAQEYRDGIRDVKRLTALFDACFLIQREACEAAGRHIPMVVENVCGAQKWVGKAEWHYGSYYLWGDVPALMPMVPHKAWKGGNWCNGDQSPASHPAKFFRELERTANAAYKSSGMNWSDRDKRGQDFTRVAGNQAGVKVADHLNIRDGHSHTRHLTNPAEDIKCPGISLSEVGFNVSMARQVTAAPPTDYRRSDEEKRQHIGFKRKAASALIAKIPFELARHIGAVYAKRMLSVERP